MRKWKTFLTVVALGVAAVSARAAAEEDPAAQGVQLRKDGRDQEALPLFQRAAKEQGTPRAFAQLGTCEQALGLWVGAEAHIKAALAHPRDPWIAKNETALKTALDYVQDRLGSVEVWGSPAGARVSIDGEPVGVLPLAGPARVAVGQRKLLIESSGFQPERRTIDVNATALVREHVVLQQATPPAGDATVVKASAPPLPPPEGAQSPATEGGDSRRTLRVLAWSSGIAAAGALIFGAVEGALWSKRVRAFDDHVGPSPVDPSRTSTNCGSDQPNRGGPGCAFLYEDISSAKALTIIGMTAGGLLAAGSATLFILSMPSEGDNPTAQARAVCSPDLLSPGLSCRFSF